MSPPSPPKKRVLLVDFANSFFSHYHFQDPDKAWKFINNIRNLTGQFRIDRVLFATEGGKSRYRLNILPSYKSDRAKSRDKQDAKEKARYERFKNEEMPDALELARMCGIPCLQVWGAEADDIISYFARHIDTDRYELCNLSTDSDLYQLLRPGVVQASYSRPMIEPLAGGGRVPAKVWMNSKQFIDQYGIEPWQYAHVKALSGDTSDSVRSPRGLGEVTALRLIQKYGDIHGVEKNLGSLDVPRLGPKIQEALRHAYCVIHRNFRVVNLHHSAEEEDLVFGQDGSQYLDQALQSLDDPPHVEQEALREWLFECGKVSVVERLDFWLQPFRGC